MISKDILLQIICNVLSVDKDKVQQGNGVSGARKAELVQARAWCMYFFKKYTTDTYQVIGEYFGRDHATAMYAINKIDDQKEIYSDMELMFQKIELAIIEIKISMAESILKSRLEIELNLFIQKAKKITADLLIEK
jgi:chromosomal replication initiation ATPase DnaA